MPNTGKRPDASSKFEYDGKTAKIRIFGKNCGKNGENKHENA